MWDSVTYIRMFSYFVFVEDGASKSHYHHLLKETNGYGDKIEYPSYWMANINLNRWSPRSLILTHTLILTSSGPKSSAYADKNRHLSGSKMSLAAGIF